MIRIILFATIISFSISQIALLPVNELEGKFSIPSTIIVFFNFQSLMIQFILSTSTKFSENLKN